MATDGLVMRLNDVEYAAGDERLMFSALLQGSGTGPFAARSGKRPGSGLGATVSSLTVTVTPGAGAIYDETYSSAGPFLFALPSSLPIDLGARPGSGQSRIDLIVARIYDPDNGLGTARELNIERVPGTAAPTPSAPDLPPMSLEIARATVPASGSVSLSVSQVRTVASGGVLPVASIAARDVLPAPYPGLVVYVEADDVLFVRGAVAWKRYVAEESGDISTTSSWTHQPLRPLRWTRQGGLIFLSGSATLNTGTVPASGGWMRLIGIPAGGDAWSGLVRSGSRVLTAFIRDGDYLDWSATVGSGTNANISLDGIVYPAAS